jgi:hypothetical protein
VGRRERDRKRERSTKEIDGERQKGEKEMEREKVEYTKGRKT